MQKGSVAIVGCGWLGLPLAAGLLAAGYRVFGSTTTEEKLPRLREAGIEASLLELPLTDAAPEELSSPLWSADQLVLNVPPRRTEALRRAYPATVLSAVLHYRRRQPSGRIVFCSSTAVYEGHDGVVTEATPLLGPSLRSRSLALAESQVQAQSQRPNVILRLAGLVGGERHPGKQLAGRQLDKGDQPVNLVSRDRVIEVVTALLDQPFWTVPVFNVVDGEHPSRAEYYTAYAKTHGLPLPQFAPGGSEAKVVSGSLLSRLLPA